MTYYEDVWSNYKYTPADIVLARGGDMIWDDMIQAPDHAAAVPGCIIGGGVLSASFSSVSIFAKKCLTPVLSTFLCRGGASAGKGHQMHQNRPTIDFARIGSIVPAARKIKQKRRSCSSSRPRHSRLGCALEGAPDADNAPSEDEDDDEASRADDPNGIQISTYFTCAESKRVHSLVSARSTRKKEFPPLFALYLEQRERHFVAMRRPDRVPKVQKPTLAADQLLPDQLITEPSQYPDLTDGSLVYIFSGGKPGRLDLTRQQTKTNSCAGAFSTCSSSTAGQGHLLPKLCVAAQVLEVLLRTADISYQTIVVNFFEKPAWFEGEQEIPTEYLPKSQRHLGPLKFPPLGLTPMLYFEGRLRGEFADIVRYLLHRFSDKFTDPARFAVPPVSHDPLVLRGLLLPNQRDAYLTLQDFADASRLPEPAPPPPPEVFKLELLKYHDPDPVERKNEDKKDYDEQQQVGPQPAPHSTFAIPLLDFEQAVYIYTKFQYFFVLYIMNLGPLQQAHLQEKRNAAAGAAERTVTDHALEKAELEDPTLKGLAAQLRQTFQDFETAYESRRSGKGKNSCRRMENGTSNTAGINEIRPEPEELATSSTDVALEEQDPDRIARMKMRRDDSCILKDENEEDADAIFLYGDTPSVIETVALTMISRYRDYMRYAFSSPASWKAVWNENEFPLLTKACEAANLMAAAQPHGAAFVNIGSYAALFLQQFCAKMGLPETDQRADVCAVEGIFSEYYKILNDVFGVMVLETTGSEGEQLDCKQVQRTNADATTSQQTCENNLFLPPAKCQNRLFELGSLFEEMFVCECGGDLEKFEVLLRGLYAARRSPPPVTGSHSRSLPVQGAPPPVVLPACSNKYTIAAARPPGERSIMMEQLTAGPATNETYPRVKLLQKSGGAEHFYNPHVVVEGASSPLHESVHLAPPGTASAAMPACAAASRRSNNSTTDHASYPFSDIRNATGVVDPDQKTLSASSSRLSPPPKLAGARSGRNSLRFSPSPPQRRNSTSTINSCF